jgi:hypothetical protein
MLTPTQTRTLRAAVDRIIPPDEFAGGWDAGVGDFLQALWAREPRFLADAVQGLDALDREAHLAAGMALADLPPDAQDALLRRAEAGEARADWPLAPAAFFAGLVRQCMEGFYADPGNGGNTGGVSWRMIGFEVTA